MGKPKGKRFVPYDRETAEALLKKIQAKGGPKIDVVLELLSATQTPCDASAPCKDNKKSNPNCLCALAPLPGSYRKQGLWAKNAKPLAVLGDDPATLARTVRPGSPNASGGDSGARGNSDCSCWHQKEANKGSMQTCPSTHGCDVGKSNSVLIHQTQCTKLLKVACSEFWVGKFSNLYPLDN